MNKQDIAGIRKELKPDNLMLKIKELYCVYIKKDSYIKLMDEINYFNMIDSEKQELFLKNFKKILSGDLDTKTFELDFKESSPIDIENSNNILCETLKSETKNTFIDRCSKIIDKIVANYKYETDVVISFIRAEYWKGAKNRSKEADEAMDDNVSVFNFMMCSINKVEPPKTVLQLDYTNMGFKTNSPLDCIINLNSPLDGFMFPCFNDNAADVNRILYYTLNLKNIDAGFIENVLNCELKKTSIEEKDEFTAILKNVIGAKISAETIHNIYENLDLRMNEDVDNDSNEIPSVNMSDIRDVLQESGVENTDNLENVFKEISGDIKTSFKIQNIIPSSNSKSIKIKSEDINISIAPKDLNNIRQIKDEFGRKCLLILLNDDISIEGFTLETESKN